MSSRKPVFSRKPDPLPAIPLAMLLLGALRNASNNLRNQPTSSANRAITRTLRVSRRKRSISSSTGSRAFR